MSNCPALYIACTNVICIFIITVHRATYGCIQNQSYLTTAHSTRLSHDTIHHLQFYSEVEIYANQLISPEKVNQWVMISWKLYQLGYFRDLGVYDALCNITRWGQYHTCWCPGGKAARASAAISISMLFAIPIFTNNDISVLWFCLCNHDIYLTLIPEWHHITFVAREHFFVLWNFSLHLHWW